MFVVEDIRKHDTLESRAVLTIGCFDGVHAGHQAILHTVLQKARESGARPAVMTLEPNPRCFFSPDNKPNILTPLPLKQRILETQGVEQLFILPFDAETAAMDRETFVEDIIVRRCGASTVVVGHDFVFGRGASGDYECLAALAGQYGFRVVQVPPLVIGGQRVSSTLIRERVLQGEVEEIELFLGRKHILSGKVIPGRGIGRVLGFPTANIDPGFAAIPAHGVYASEAVIQGQSHPAAVNIGIAPTIRQKRITVEAYILNFDGDIMGMSVDLVFHKHLRPEKKFSSRDELVAAIAQDVQNIQTYFAAVSSEKSTVKGYRAFSVSETCGTPPES